MRRLRNVPPGGTRARDPLIGVATPGNPVAAQGVVARVGPVGALSHRPVQRATAVGGRLAAAGTGNVTIGLLVENGGRGSLSDEVIESGILIGNYVAPGLLRIKAEADIVTERRDQSQRQGRNRDQDKHAQQVHYQAALPVSRAGKRGSG